MGILRGLLDRIVLIGAVLAAGCVPSFVAQYQQRLGGMLDQATKDLALFQEIANRFHGGDINRLIKHHLASTDPTFRSEGKAIQTLVDSVASLKQSLAALNTDLFNQVRWMATEGDSQVARATWDAFVPAMSLTTEALLFAFSTGVIVWLVFLAVWFGSARLLRGGLFTRRAGTWATPKKKLKA
jgi:hypothetical protein